MKKILFFTLVISLQIYNSHAQIKISTSTAAPAATSILEIESSNRGFLPPRIALSSTTMLLNGITPTDGMVVFNTNFNSGLGGLCVWHTAKWNKLNDSPPGGGRLTNFIQLKQNNSQAIGGGNNNIIWDAVQKSQAPSTDTQMWTSGSDITIRTEGIYCVTADIATTKNSGSAVAERYAFITRNNIQVTASGYCTSEDPYLHVSAILYCKVNDVIRIGYSNGGGNMTTWPVYMNCTVAQMPPNVY